MKPKIERCKNRRLIFNPVFSPDTAQEVVDRWEKSLEDEGFAAEVASITKRKVIFSKRFETDNRRYIAKFYRTRGLRRSLGAFLFLPESLRTFKTALKLLQAGLLTPVPLCVWGEWKLGIHRWSVLFMEDLGDLPILSDFLDAIDPEDSEKKARVSSALAVQLARLHQLGVYVHDPSKNILVKGDGESEISFYFIDFDTVLPYRKLNRRRVARVLRHCIRPPKQIKMFTPDEKAAYVKKYLEIRDKPGWFDYILPKV